LSADKYLEQKSAFEQTSAIKTLAESNFMKLKQSALLLLVSALFCVTCFANEEKLRIQELVPESWIAYPVINPAIPSNYQLKELSEVAAAIWGTEDDLKNFGEQFENHSELIFLAHAYDVAQIGPHEFSHEQDLAKAFEEIGTLNFKSEKLNWGAYPVLAIEGTSAEGYTFRAAWVGLNAEGGMTLFMVHQPPMGRSGCCQVWNEFLHQTTQLSDYEFLKAKGHDMQEGYTIFKAASAALKITAEKRARDGLLAVLVEPMTPNTTFQVDEIGEDTLASGWKEGADCAILAGVMTEEDGKYGTCVVPTHIVVLTKSVDNFSFSLDAEDHGTDVVIHTQKAP
jgi:hypothetical protein